MKSPEKQALLTTRMKFLAAASAGLKPSGVLGFELRIASIAGSRSNREASSRD
jgi:hypothetical protein